jgi:hypothetical protein
MISLGKGKIGIKNETRYQSGFQKLVGKTVRSKSRYSFIIQCIAFEDSLLFTS